MTTYKILKKFGTYEFNPKTLASKIKWYEVDDIVGNQYFVGKDPDYNYAVNPINPGLENFGSDLSIICKTHYTPVDKVQIEKGRING